MRVLTGALLAAVLLGAARQHHASIVEEPFNQGISEGHRIADALMISRRVADRFRDIEAHGPAGEPSSWLLRSNADRLLTGGDCGDAALALGALFVSRGLPFRIVQVNVGEMGANHIMVEARDDDGRWVLIDAIEGRAFSRPGDSRLLGIDDIRALPPGDRDWLPEIYRDGDYSLFGPYRRTNWSRLGPLAAAVRAVAGDAWMQETSVRAVLLRADRALVIWPLLALVLVAVARLFAIRRTDARATCSSA